MGALKNLVIIFSLLFGITSIEGRSKDRSQPYPQINGEQKLGTIHPLHLWTGMASKHIILNFFAMAIIACLSCWPVATYCILTNLEKMLKAKNVITLPPDIGIKTTKNIKTRSDLSDCRFVNKFLTFCRKENVELSDVDTTILFISSIIIFGDSPNPSIFSTPRNHLRETTASSGRFLHI